MVFVMLLQSLYFWAVNLRNKGYHIAVCSKFTLVLWMLLLCVGGGSILSCVFLIPFVFYFDLNVIVIISFLGICTTSPESDTLIYCYFTLLLF